MLLKEGVEPHNSSPTFNPEGDPFGPLLIFFFFHFCSAFYSGMAIVFVIFDSLFDLGSSVSSPCQFVVISLLHILCVTVLLEFLT